MAITPPDRPRRRPQGTGEHLEGLVAIFRQNTTGEVSGFAGKGASQGLHYRIDILRNHEIARMKPDNLFFLDPQKIERGTIDTAEFAVGGIQKDRHRHRVEDFVIRCLLIHRLQYQSCRPRQHRANHRVQHGCGNEDEKRPLDHPEVENPSRFTDKNSNKGIREKNPYKRAGGIHDRHQERAAPRKHMDKFRLASMKRR